MVTEEKREFDMLDYLQRGKTMYDKLDYYLGGYLKGDYSSNNLLNSFRNYITDFNHTESEKTFLKKVYSDFFNILISNIDTATGIGKPSEKIKVFNADEKAEFLKKLQSIDKDDENHFLPTIGAYLRLLKSNNFSEEYYKNPEFYANLNKMIIDKGLEISGEEVSRTIKKSIVGAYTIRIANYLKQKYPDRADRYYPEWEEFNFINQTFASQKRFEEYDKVLSDYQKETASYEEKLATQIRCKEKRKRYVESALYSGMKPEEQKQIKENSTIIDRVYPAPINLKLVPDDHIWNIKLYNRPKYICDSIARYSKLGEENQRVVAVSYGMFESESMFNQNNVSLSKDTMQFLGISRLGKDGLKNYFVLAPLSNNVLMKALEFDDGEDEKTISIDEFGTVMKRASGQNKNYIYRIPQELEDYYTTVAFSDECLEKAIIQNNRFAGAVDMSRGRPRISAGYREQARNIEAAWHACRYPGSIGGRMYPSLNHFCKSTELLAKHIETVNEMTISSSQNRYQGDVR